MLLQHIGNNRCEKKSVAGVIGLMHICAVIVKLMIGNRLVDLRQFPDKNLAIKGYIEGLKNDMLEQNEHLIYFSKEPPKFRFEFFPFLKSYMN